MEKHAKTKIDIADEYSYAVVQFLELPYVDIADYICVPRSWIRSRRHTDRRSDVIYPSESPLVTKMRVMNGDKPSGKWKSYKAIIKSETYSYEDANKFIMEKMQNTSEIRYSPVMRSDYRPAPAAATEVHSSLLKRTILSDPQPEKNKKKVKTVDKARLSDTISNPSKSPKYSNVELLKPTSSKLPSYVSPKNIMMKKPDEIENQEQISRDVRPPDDDLLLRYPYLQRISEKGNGTQVNSSEAGFQSTIRKKFYASQNPLILINQVCDGYQQTQENDLLSKYRDHLHHIALTQGMQNKVLPNLRTFDLDVPKPLKQDLDIGSNTSFTICNSVSKTNQPSQGEVPKPSPVYQNCPQDSSIEKIHKQSSEVRSASVGCSNLGEHQDSTTEVMVVGESSKERYYDQSVLSQLSTENESSTVPKHLKNPNHSHYSAENSMEEDPSGVHIVTTSDTSSTQNSDSDKQSTSPEISSEEIMTASSNSNKRANGSVTSILNMADVWADRLADLFEAMKVNSSETCQLFNDMNKSLAESYKVIETMANKAKEFRELSKGKTNVVTSKKVTLEVQQITEENEVEGKEKVNPDINMKEYKKGDKEVDSKKNQYNDDDVDNDGEFKDDKDKHSDNKVPKKTRGNIRTFVLPPEYDPDDTRWTLKYRKNDPKLNLVELVPGSNVFINSIKLAHCKRTAKDSKALARMLLVEIFSQSALSVCSLTGVRANAFDISGTNVRPGLDERARLIILTSVEDYALKRKWIFNTQDVINSMRSKIQDIRAKHGKTA